MSKQKETFLSFTKGHFQSSEYSFDWKGTAFIFKKKRAWKRVKLHNDV